MTDQETIDARIAAGKTRARERQAQMRAARTRSKAHAAQLRDHGYKIDYSLLDDGRHLSVAYKPDGKKVRLIFALRSKRDTFSKAGARAALVKHLENNTHTLTIRAAKPIRECIAEPLAMALIQRIETHPKEFPAWLVRDAKREKAIRQEALEHLQKFSDTLDRFTRRVTP